MDQYGPNDREVLRFLASVARLTVEQAAALTRVRAESDPALLERGGWAAERAALMSERTDALEAARDAIRAGRRFRTGSPWFGRAIRVYWRRPPRGHFETMTAATPALLDAISALVVRDVLDPGTFELLSRPWGAAQAIAPPASGKR